MVSKAKCWGGGGDKPMMWSEVSLIHVMNNQMPAASDQDPDQRPSNRLINVQCKNYLISDEAKISNG